MSNSPNLGLPYIAANQAQKHIPHNDALALIDGLLQIAFVARGLNGPPANVADGNRFLVGSSPSGPWAGKAGLIAFYNNGLWQFLTPQAGWVAWIAAEKLLVVFDGANWVQPASAGPLNLSNATGVLPAAAIPTLDAGVI